ncbi:MAG: hypothetical protein JNG84_09230 [Archangium sp.]|nr:hypothetical protein [Archangium sp.]
MRRIVAVLWLVVLVGVLAAVALPAIWLYTASTLPMPVESAADIERLLRSSAESDRRSLEVPKREVERRDETWPTPDPSALPPLLRALTTAELGCPRYDDTPSETGWPWTRRIIAVVLEATPTPGDGHCELALAMRLASRLGAVTPLQRAVVADRVHTFLTKSQLVAFDLASQRHQPGIIGPEAASLELLQKPLAQLTAAELAELQLALPPSYAWDEVHQCTNAAMIRQVRDSRLEGLAAAGHLAADALKHALDEPVRCLSVTR